ncbi:hypothetical protein D3C73_1669080 [compost metagenome]
MPYNRRLRIKCQRDRYRLVLKLLACEPNLEYVLDYLTPEELEEHWNEYYRDL